MKHLIFAVGGTGQVILHYYNLLFLAGEIDQTFDAVVLDTDSPILSLSYLSKSYEQAANVLSDNNERWRPPNLKLHKMPVGAGTQIHDLLTGESLAGEAGYYSPVQAYFTRDCLAQNTVPRALCATRAFVRRGRPESLLR
jgi:hypothetical protein